MERPSLFPGDRHGPPRLVICPLCGCDYVVPVAGEEIGEDSWELVLRCGACGVQRELVASDEEVDALCTDIDVGLGRLELGLERLHRERREDEIELFAAALARDLISSDDFGSRSVRWRTGS
jgi:hypothetical protein